jgi:ceramide glucosyltransferase
MSILLQGVSVLLIVGSTVFYLACAWVTWRFFHSSNPGGFSGDSELPESAGLDSPLSRGTNLTSVDPFQSPTSLPAVSILVPVCGVDAGAWENWSSLCTQNYPNYEVLFGVTDPEDPCIPVVKKLMTAFPDRVRLYSGLKPRGINYKDSNLSYLLEKAKYEVIIFADSDIRVHANYIETVTAPLADKQVGLVTCAFIGYNPKALGAAIASTGRCFDFIPSLLIARVLDGGLRCAVGATIATRKSTLTNFGGLHLNRIGSDYNLGKRAATAGYRVELSRYVLESDTGTETVAQVFQRELRWARTIRYNRGPQYYTMLFCYGTVYCLPLLLVSEFEHWAIVLTLATFIVRYLQILITIFSIGCPKLLRWLWVVPFRDFLSFLIWGIGGFGKGVYWRGRRLRIEGDGLITQWQ